MASIRLKTEPFRVLALSRGWTRRDGNLGFKAAANAIGCEVSTVMRAYSGESNCGERFIAALLTVAAPLRFDDLFQLDGNHRRDAA